jgi:NitT/TauT family transport system permease protein
MSAPAGPQNIATQVIVVPVLLLAWEACVRVLDVSTDKLPPPSIIIEAIWEYRTFLVGAVGTTLTEAIIGLIAGTIFGVLSGIVFSRSRIMERMFLPYFVGSQAVPILAFGAIIIMWFGNGIASKAVIAFYLSFFPVAVNTLSGMRSVGEDEIGLLRTFGASSWTILYKLQLPAALPAIFTSIRLGASLALIGAIVGEWFGATQGLGAVLLTAMYEYRIDYLWAGIVLTGITGVVMYGVVTFMQKRIAWWHTEA